MTAQQFDLRLAAIDQETARLGEAKDAYRDQETARLFMECGWTQQQIAERMGKKQDWVSRRLLFGRFLDFMASGHNPATGSKQLTERRFREFWKRTKGTKGSKNKEADRFAQVAHALEHGIPHGMEALVNKPGIGKAVLDCLADGKWYTVTQITATVEEDLVGITEEQVRDALTVTRKKPPAGHMVETKRISTKCQYRLVAKPSAPPDTTPAALPPRFVEQVVPLLDELDEIGAMHVGRISPGMVRKVSFRLRQILDAMLHEATA